MDAHACMWRVWIARQEAPANCCLQEEVGGGQVRDGGESHICSLYIFSVCL